MHRAVSILAAGPSLRTARPDEDSIVIAVNLAANVFRSYQWLAFGDANMIPRLVRGEIRPPRIGYFVVDELVKPLREAVTFGTIIPWSAIHVAEDPGSTANYCLRFAAEVLCATDLDLYGFDHSGNRYADGSTFDLSELRWPRERRQFDGIVHTLQTLGMSVTQHH